MDNDISIEVASGILIAVLLLTIGRYGLDRAREGDWGMALPSLMLFCLIGGSFILAGLGTIDW